MNESLEEHFDNCQAIAGDAGERIQALGLLLQGYKPELKTNGREVRTIGYILEDLAEEVLKVHVGLDCVTMEKIKSGVEKPFSCRE